VRVGWYREVKVKSEESWGTTLTAIIVIPVTVLVTLMAMRMAGLSFNLMTLGGIAAAMGLVIDDAIVVVQAICAKCAAGSPRTEAIHSAIAKSPARSSAPPLRLWSCSFRWRSSMASRASFSAPSLAAWFIREHSAAPAREEGGFILRRIIRLYESAVRVTLRYPWANFVRLRPRACRGHHSLWTSRKRFSPRIGRRRLCHRLSHPIWNQPHGNEPPTLKGRGDFASHARGGKLLAAHRRPTRTCYR
jgi:hypothetical protein